MERRKSGQAIQITQDALDELPARLILERMPVPSLAIAGDGQILFANDAFGEMVGYSTGQVLAMKFSDFFHSLPADESPISVVRKYADKLVELRHAEGSVIRARMSKSALRREDDPLALATFHDLSEQLWSQGR